MNESQKILLIVWAGLFGLCIGSFLNVCIFRLPRNCMSVRGPRSRCPRCRTQISWYDNLPVVSWLLLGGRCRSCRVPISARYALVELLTGALYAYAAWSLLMADGAPVSDVDKAALFAFQAWFLGALIVSTFIDLEFRILPDEITLSGVVVGVVFSAAFPVAHDHPGALLAVPHGVLGGAAEALLGALLGAGSIWIVGQMGKLLFRKEAMGFGDVKFMAMVGAVLGARGVLLTFFIACLLGSLFGLGKYAVVRRMGYVPFGPFLAGGALVLLFWSPWVDRAIDAYIRLLQGGRGA